MNRAACQAAPRVREAQNLRISLLNSLLAEVRREIDTFGYFDLMAGSKPCCLNIGF